MRGVRIEIYKLISSHLKMSILAEAITGRRSVPMFNSIVRSIFIRIYLEN